MVVNRLLGNAWSDLSGDFLADPMKLRISPLAPQRMLAHKSRIRRIADYGQLWHFLLWGHQLAMFRDQSAMLEEHLSQKLMRDHAYSPKIWPKM